MHVKCESLVNMPIGKKLRLIGGEKGVNRLMTWAQIYLGKKELLHMKGGEVIIVTSHNVDRREDLLCEEVKLIYENNGSAVVYMEECGLSEKNINALSETANKYNIPVFYTCKECTVRDIQESVYKLVFGGNNINRDTLGILSDLIFHTKISLTDALSEAACFGFHANNNYVVAIIKNEFMDGGAREKNEYVYHVFSNYIINNYNDVLTMYWKDMLVIMFLVGDMFDEQDIKKKLKDSYIYAKNIYAGLNVSIGLGKIVNHLKYISNSFYEALRVVDSSPIINNGGECEIFTYEDLGFYRLIYEMRDTNEIREMYKETMGVIEQYDKENNSELLETLEAYIDTNCNMQETAENLFVHKNSVRYRISRIEEITGKSLRDVENVMLFYMCFKIKKFLVII